MTVHYVVNELNTENAMLYKLMILSTNKGGCLSKFKLKNKNDLRISCEDLYYEKAFSRIMNNEKIVWNTAAFFWVYNWLYYRKMYLNSFLYIVVFLISFVTMMMLFSVTQEPGKLNFSFMFLIISALFLSLHIGTGLFGNYLYYKHLRKKIRKGYYRLRYLNNTDSFTFLFSIPIPMIGFITGPIIAFSDYIRVINSKFPKDRLKHHNQDDYPEETQDHAA